MTGSATICCLGKLPLFGDFVRLNSDTSPCLLALDRWLLQGIEHGYLQSGRAFESRLRSFEPLRVLAWSDPERCWSGFLLPSVDAVGRVYPFLAGWELHSPLPAPELVPLIGIEDLQALYGLVERARQDLPALDVFLEQIGAATLRQDPGGSDDVLRGFLQAHTLEELCGRWPEGHDPGRRARSLHDLSLLGSSPAPPRYLTMIPHAGWPAEVGFWLRLVGRWMEARKQPTIVAWPVFASASGSIRLLYDRLEARYVEQLLWPEEHSRSALDLRVPSAAGRAAPGYEAFAREVPSSGLLQHVIGAASDF